MTLSREFASRAPGRPDAESQLGDREVAVSSILHNSGRKAEGLYASLEGS